MTLIIEKINGAGLDFVEKHLTLNAYIIYHSKLGNVVDTMRMDLNDN